MGRIKWAGLLIDETYDWHIINVQLMLYVNSDKSYIK